MLLSTAELGYAMEQVMTNPGIATGKDGASAQSSTEIRRQRVISDVIEEHVRITNFNPFPITLDLLYEFDADFADIFDVRGYERARKGTLRRPQIGERSILYAYDGIDGRARTTRIEFDRAPGAGRRAQRTVPCAARAPRDRDTADAHPAQQHRQAHAPRRPPRCRRRAVPALDGSVDADLHGQRVLQPRPRSLAARHPHALE